MRIAACPAGLPTNAATSVTPGSPVRETVGLRMPASSTNHSRAAES